MDNVSQKTVKAVEEMSEAASAVWECDKTIEYLKSCINEVSEKINFLIKEKRLKLSHIRGILLVGKKKRFIEECYNERISNLKKEESRHRKSLKNAENERKIMVRHYVDKMVFLENSEEMNDDEWNDHLNRRHGHGIGLNGPKARVHNYVMEKYPKVYDVNLGTDGVQYYITHKDRSMLY